MSGKRVGQKVVDWARITSRLPESLRPELSAFRGRHEACRASMNAYTEKPEPIDWDYYRKTISKPNLVDDFKKHFDALSVPYPKDYATAEIEERKQKTEVEVKAAVEKAKVKIAELQEKLDKLNAEKPLDDMTVDEYLADKPELRKKAEEDTKNQEWHFNPIQ